MRPLPLPLVLQLWISSAVETMHLWRSQALPFTWVTPRAPQAVRVAHSLSMSVERALVLRNMGGGWANGRREVHTLRHSIKVFGTDRSLMAKGFPFSRMLHRSASGGRPGCQRPHQCTRGRPGPVASWRHEAMVSAAKLPSVRLRQRRRLASPRVSSPVAFVAYVALGVSIVSFCVPSRVLHDCISVGGIRPWK